MALHPAIAYLDAVHFVLVNLTNWLACTYSERVNYRMVTSSSQVGRSVMISRSSKDSSETKEKFLSNTHWHAGMKVYCKTLRLMQMTSNALMPNHRASATPRTYPGVLGAKNAVGDLKPTTHAAPTCEKCLPAFLPARADGCLRFSVVVLAGTLVGVWAIKIG